MKQETSVFRAPEKPVHGAQETALLNAARNIFVNEGVKGLSVRRVAESAGCTTMAVYSRFKGKAEILGALFDEGFEQLASAQQAVAESLERGAGCRTLSGLQGNSTSLSAPLCVDARTVQRRTCAHRGQHEQGAGDA
jgi:AcrR family transcriptional regulator